MGDRKDIQFEAESFAKLYPTWLYPGESERDPTSSSEAPFTAQHSLNSLDPVGWRKAAARISRRGPGVAVIPAWTFFLGPALGTIARYLKRHGLKVMMIVHNAADHERSLWKSRLSNWQLAAADGFVVHTDEVAHDLRKAGHTQPICVIPHPIFTDFPEAQHTLPRRGRLELLCFGLVRHYKGVDIALRALAHPGLEGVHLTVAGEIWEGEKDIRALAQSRALDGRVELVSRYVSDVEAAEYFVRCDAVLAPYRSVSGSGVLAVAQHYRRPVIAADLPGFSGLIEHGKNGWLFPTEDEAALARLLRDRVSRQSAQALGRNIAGELSDGGWREYADALIAFANGEVNERFRPPGSS
ncbi:glycosyltransferase [Croceibacterium sp. LX-88]|uniref:Glycosyltransferase n=1 Tax=Croceibacterium selenioxidans TaxID=2838833 RepID=A0ABS5W3C2_9SPHN|nr:glycosyltransferase [Croceibacterium selenioxidans]